MIKLVKRAWNQDRGAALAVIATTLFLLMGVAAISADLAWYYLNASRVQRAADAAALAGVVHLPQQPGDANDTALDIALRNGYDNTAAGTSVTPDDISAFQLQVRISTEVDTFFAKILGWDQMTIARTAVAEYIPPLKLGNPGHCFGNGPDPGDGCPEPNFWASIHGYWTDTVSGDAYSSHCAVREGNDDPSCAGNDWDRETGYLYGIESDSSFVVEFNDLAFRNTSNATSCPGNKETVPDGCTSDWTRTGDRGCEEWGEPHSPDCGPTMRVALYSPDATPLAIDSTPICEATIPPLPQVPVSEPYPWESPDSQPCWQQSGDGIWVLQVQVVEPVSSSNRAGYNRYSVRSTTGSLFAVGDFSLFNSVGATTKFYLAEVPSYYNGRTFVVELWDAGDAKDRDNEDETGMLRVIDPTGTAFKGPCRVHTRDTSDPDDAWSPVGPQPRSVCEESVATKEYNGKWLKFEMDLPPTYSCTNCWWQIEYDYPSGVNDTTTWRAYMIGNPIHLID